MSSIDPHFLPGTRVVRDARHWQPSEFDDWGRGQGVGEVVTPPFELDPTVEVDVRWPCGRCFESIDGLRDANSPDAVFDPMRPRFAQTALHRGAVLAYPTEGVWGLGCDPLNEATVLRLLTIKQRDIAKGLILIAADEAQLTPFVDMAALTEAQRNAVHASWPGPNTWIVPASANAPTWITGQHIGIAVRVSAHPEVVALCQAFGGALVSTSANLAGQPSPRRREELEPGLLATIDGVLQGESGGREAPSVIRDVMSGQVLRT